MLLLSKITILHIFDRFGDHTTKKKFFLHKTLQTSAQSQNVNRKIIPVTNFIISRYKYQTFNTLLLKI